MPRTSTLFLHLILMNAMNIDGLLFVLNSCLLVQIMVA